MDELKQLTACGWELPYSSRVDSLVNYQYTYSVEDDLIVEDLYEYLYELSDDDLTSIKAIALSEPALVHHLVSQEGHVAAIYIHFNLPDDVNAAIGEVALQVRKIRDEFKTKFPDVDIHQLGKVMGSYAFAE